LDRGPWRHAFSKKLFLYRLRPRPRIIVVLERHGDPTRAVTTQTVRPENPDDFLIEADARGYRLVGLDYARGPSQRECRYESQQWQKKRKQLPFEKSSRLHDDAESFSTQTVQLLPATPLSAGLSTV